MPKARQPATTTNRSRFDEPGAARAGAGPSEWLLEALAPEKLAAALDGHGPTEVQFNPELSILLLPGAFTAAGTSFFRLRG